MPQVVNPNRFFVKDFDIKYLFGSTNFETYWGLFGNLYYILNKTLLKPFILYWGGKIFNSAKKSNRNLQIHQ